MVKLYEGYFEEINGEQEYGHYTLTYAESIEEAEKRIMEYLKGWYDDEDVEPYEDHGWEFFCGCIIVELKNVSETTEQDFKDRAFMRALVG